MGGLTLTSGAVQVDNGDYATIGSTLASTAGFTKSGSGSLYLTGTNSITGLTTIEQGIVVINSAAALGSDTSTIIINGFSSRGLRGGGSWSSHPRLPPALSRG